MQPQWRSTLCRPRPVMCDPSPEALHVPRSERPGTNQTGQWRWRAWLAWQTQTWRKTEVGTGEQGPVRTALGRGLSLRPQSFLFGIGKKLKVITAKSSSLVKTTSKSVTFLFSFGTRPFIFLFYGKPREKAHCDLVKCFTVVAQFMFVNPCTNVDRPLLCVA